MKPLLVAGCVAVALAGNQSGPTEMDKIAEGYVKLVLAVGQHDPDYVDAYYGPPGWKPAKADKQPLEALAAQAAQLGATVQPAAGQDARIFRAAAPVPQLAGSSRAMVAK